MLSLFRIQFKLKEFYINILNLYIFFFKILFIKIYFYLKKNNIILIFYEIINQFIDSNNLFSNKFFNINLQIFIITNAYN